MATDGNCFVYETIPSRYSPLRLASSCPLDNYDSLTRSMRDLTTYADLIARALAADTDQQTRRKSKAAGDGASGRQDANARSAPADALRLCLRPSIDWRQNAEGFVLSAATPGLRKDELKVEVLDDRGESYLEISGQSVDKLDPHTNKDAGQSPRRPTRRTRKKPSWSCGRRTAASASVCGCREAWTVRRCGRRTRTGCCW